MFISTADDDVLHPASDSEIAGVVTATQVPERIQPPATMVRRVAEDRRGSRASRPSAVADLTHLAVRQRCAGVVGNESRPLPGWAASLVST